MTKRKRKKTKNTQEYKFNKTFAYMIKGMLISVEKILEFDEKLVREGDPEAFSPGCRLSSTILSSFTAELLLKYKITEEGNKFHETHDLSELYDKLKQESKSSIENEYRRLTSNMKLHSEYNNVESVYFTSKDDFLKWRYISIIPNKYIGNDDIAVTAYPAYIHLANLSVYHNTQLPTEFYSTEVTDDDLKTLYDEQDQDYKNMITLDEFIKNLRNK